MIEFFHKHRSTVLGTFVSAIVAFSMLGFGVGFLGDSGRQAAITIGEDEVSFDEFYEQRRKIDARYRSMFGQNYYRLAEQLNLNLNQTTADTIIADYLLTDFTSKLGLAAGDELVAQTIQSELFPEGFSNAAYAGYLAQVGMTARQFQEEVRQDIQRRLLRELIEDIAPPTRAEVNELIVRALTSYDLSFIEISADPEAVPAPEPQILQDYYNEHAAEFEEPEKVAYNYAVLDLASFPDLVPVSEEEVELFYSDNLGRFIAPARISVRKTLFDLPTDASEEKKKEVRDVAAKVVEEINSGKEPSEVLAAQVQDKKFEDLGWLTEADRKLKPVVSKRAFSLAPQKGEKAASIELPGSITVVVVTERIESRTKELKEVAQEIRTEITKQAAPAFLLAKGQEIFDTWTEDADMPLEKVLGSHNLKLESTKKPSAAPIDPAPQLRGLTQRILQDTSTDRQLLDVGEKVVLVEVTKRLESKIPTLDEIKDKILTQYKSEEALKAAKAKAQAIIDDADLVSKGLTSIAAEKTLGEVKKVASLSQKQPVRNKLSGTGAVQKVFSGEAGQGVIPELFAGQNSFFIVSVDKITPPAEDRIEKEFPTYESQAKEETSREFITALINHQKARAAIEVNPAVLGGE